MGLALCFCLPGTSVPGFHIPPLRGSSRSNRPFHLLVQLLRFQAKRNNCPDTPNVNRFDLAASLFGLHLDRFLWHVIASSFNQAKTRSPDYPIHYRSISPKTISMLPIAATTSASSLPSHIVGSVCIFARHAERICTR